MLLDFYFISFKFIIPIRLALKAMMATLMSQLPAARSVVPVYVACLKVR
jgi:hypothetical protein